MVALPADHHIEDEATFRACSAPPTMSWRAVPSRSRRRWSPWASNLAPGDEYGYLVPDLDHRRRGKLTAYQLRAFEEKPEPPRAVQLLNEPGVAWNAGMFLWQRRAIRAALEKYTPLMLMIGQATAPTWH